MATTQSVRRPRLRRWLVAIAIVLALTVSYVLALQQIAQRIGGDIQDSLRAAPVLDDHTPRLN